MRILTTVLGLSFLLTSCSTIELLDGLCYNDRDGTFLCPPEQEEIEPTPQGDPIRNDINTCRPEKDLELDEECVLIA